MHPRRSYIGYHLSVGKYRKKTSTIESIAPQISTCNRVAYCSNTY